MLMLLPCVAAAEDAPPAIVIIIDDMGNQLAEGRRALQLPGAVTYSFLPHTPHAHALAEQAHRQGKEVMLHLPMDAYRGNRLGPGALTLHMTEANFRETLGASLAAVPHVAGLNNHMGSLLTSHPGAMSWLMRSLREHGDLYFVDSRTSVMTVAEQVARENGLATAGRDVFLDHVHEPDAIRAQFQLLIQIARRRGQAIGIGHPHPETVAVLTEELARLELHGVRLVPASQLINGAPAGAATILAEPAEPPAPRIRAATETAPRQTDSAPINGGG